MKRIKKQILESLGKSKTPWRFFPSNRSGITVRFRPFTIIEMLVVIAILAVVGGIVSVSIHRAYVQQRFRSEVAVVVNTLRLAQDLMIILHDDVHVKFIEDKGNGIQFWLETESPLAKAWEQEIQRTHKTLTVIHSIKFRDELLGTVRYGELDIKFLSGGSVMSRGTIRLATTDDETRTNALRSAICLLGFPHPINSYPEDVAREVCLKGTDEAFDNRLTDQTVLAVNAPLSEEEHEEES